jgi:4'-phosphopantetheinyl transferase
MTTSGRTPSTGRLDLIPGTEVEVLRSASPAGSAETTVVWLPTDRLDTQLLSAEITATERQRAAGYTRESDRLLSLGSAWLTRRLVGICLDVEPLDAPILRKCAQCDKPHGRPLVSMATRDGETVQVSATHSHGLVGVAVSTSDAVGLDVENLRTRDPDAWSTVWRVLGHPTVPESEDEHEAAHQAATAWVRTEAVLKATGHGLAVGRRSVDITTGSGPRVLRWPWGDPTDRVSLFDLHPGKRYVAALAVIHDVHSAFTTGITSGLAGASAGDPRDSPALGTKDSR